MAQHPAQAMFFWKPTWLFGEYLSSFYGCDTVRLIELSARVNGDNARVAAVADVIHDRQTSGGRVFIEDAAAEEKFTDVPTLVTAHVGHRRWKYVLLLACD
ncbi:MAG: hypothetical protein ACK44M_07475 [Chloroflexus sp.]